MEVFRSSVGKTPLHPEDPRIVAIASDAEFPSAGIPHVDINNIEAVAAMVLARAEPLGQVMAALVSQLVGCFRALRWRQSPRRTPYNSANGTRLRLFTRPR